MFEAKDLTIKVNNRFLIKNLSFVLKNGDKLAIIGEEGNGKSTLLKSILGICKYSEITGNIYLKGTSRIGYLEQSMNEENLDQKCYDFLFEDANEYYQKVNNLYKYLGFLNLTDQVLDQIMNTLSGGERVKIGILKLLLNEYDILFLDEPTNDLDIETLEWLENFINCTNKPIVYISHDETLLSHTANMILHLEQIKKKTACRHTILKTDYDTYRDLRLKKIEKQTQVARSEKREFDKQQEKLKRIMQKVEYQQNTISRKDPHGAKMLKKKMHSLKAQEKKHNQLELTEIPDIEEGIYIIFEDVKIPKTKNIIQLNISNLKIGQKELCQNIELNVIGNTHICIIGKNGVGKSTFLKLIYDQLKERKDLKVGYMPQNYEDILNKYEKVLDFLSANQKKEEITKAKMYLGNMKFTKEEMEGTIKELSNGNKAKLFLVKLSLDKCNCLILDEPTRNLSPLSNPVIRNVLKEYQGTIISVSHDRKYIEEVVDCVYLLTSTGLTRKN